MAAAPPKSVINSRRLMGVSRAQATQGMRKDITLCRRSRSTALLLNVRFGSKAELPTSPRNVRFASKSGHQLQLIELQPGRLCQVDVRDNFPGNHGVKFLWADGHRFDTLRRKFGSHRGQRQRVLYLEVQLFDD